MMAAMTEEQIRQGAEFYGITMEEARERYRIVQEHMGDPTDPICVGCAKRPEEFPFLVEMAEDEGYPDAKAYVIHEEGTFNRENGHFLCDGCYIRNGQPSKPFPDRWVCP